MRIALAAFFVLFIGSAMRAQNPAITPGVISSATTATHATCPTNYPNLCIVADGVYVCQGAGASCYVPAAAAGAISLTLNGVTKTLPASFTVSAAAPSVSAPTISASSSAPSASAPAITAQ